MRGFLDSLRNVFNGSNNIHQRSVREPIDKTVDEDIKIMFDNISLDSSEIENRTKISTKIHSALKSVSSWFSNAYEFLHKKFSGFNVPPNLLRNIKTPSRPSPEGLFQSIHDQMQQREISKLFSSGLNSDPIEKFPAQSEDTDFFRESKDLNTLKSEITSDGNIDFMKFFENFKKNKKDNPTYKIQNFSPAAIKYANFLILKYRDNEEILNGNTELKELLDAAQSLIDANAKINDESLKALSITEIFEEISLTTGNPTPDQSRERDINDKAKFILNAFFPDFETFKNTEEFKDIESYTKKFIGWQQLWSEVIIAESDANINYISDSYSDESIKIKNSYVERLKNSAIDAFNKKHPIDPDTILACKKFTSLYKITQATGTQSQIDLLEESDLQKYVDDFSEYYGEIKEDLSVSVRESINDLSGEVEENNEIDSNFKHGLEIPPEIATKITGNINSHRNIDRSGSNLLSIPDFPLMTNEEFNKIRDLMSGQMSSDLVRQTIVQSSEYFGRISKGEVPTAESKANAIALANAWSNLSWFSKTSFIILEPKFRIFDELLDVKKINKDFDVGTQ